MNTPEDTAVEDKVDNDIVVAEGQETEMTPLQVLLSAKPVRQKRTLRIRQRDGLDADLLVTVRSLTDREFKGIGEESEMPVDTRRQARRSAQQAKETDNNLFLRLIVATAIEDPKLGDAKVLASHGAVTAEQIVQRVFLPGEIAKIAEEVMDLSGWSDDAVEIETAKN